MTFGMRPVPPATEAAAKVAALQAGLGRQNFRQVATAALDIATTTHSLFPDRTSQLRRAHAQMEEADARLSDFSNLVLEIKKRVESATGQDGLPDAVEPALLSDLKKRVQNDSSVKAVFANTIVVEVGKRAKGETIYFYQPRDASLIELANLLLRQNGSADSANTKTIVDMVFGRLETVHAELSQSMAATTAGMKEVLSIISTDFKRTGAMDFSIGF